MELHRTIIRRLSGCIAMSNEALSEAEGASWNRDEGIGFGIQPGDEYVHTEP
jgi:hypothetical protein